MVLRHYEYQYIMVCVCVCDYFPFSSAPGILSKGSSSSQQHRLTPSHSHNSSITASPFNANILQALGQQQVTTPTNKSVDILDDSLGMLSTVALLDSEMSNVNTTGGTSMQERLAGMKINSHHGTMSMYIKY